MTKRRLTAIAAAAVLAAAALIYFSGKKPEPAVGTTAIQEPASASLGVGPHEITIRNITKKPVHYSLRAYGSDSPAVERMLLPEEIDRYPAPQTVIISYLKHGAEVTYSLFPGKPYSFRYDSAGNIDIWVGAHGREDAVDLAPYVPTPPEVLAEMCVLGGVDKNSIVYDIGCGDGRIVIHAARTYGARGVGIDIEPERIRESRENAKAARVERLVRFKLADATKVDISEATVVMMYLLPESNELLRPKLEKELKPGVLVVTHNYMIPGWEDREVQSKIVLDGEHKEHTIFLYRR